MNDAPNPAAALRVGEKSVAARFLEATNNKVCEHKMKRIVLNRENSLFVGNERAGLTAAILSSLDSTCRRPASTRSDT